MGFNSKIIDGQRIYVKAKTKRKLFVIKRLHIMSLDHASFAYLPYLSLTILDRNAIITLPTGRSGTMSEFLENPKAWHAGSSG